MNHLNKTNNTTNNTTNNLNKTNKIPEPNTQIKQPTKNQLNNNPINKLFSQTSVYFNKQNRVTATTPLKPRREV